MVFYKVLLFLLINLISLYFNLAQESENSGFAMGVRNAVHSKFPFISMYGRDNAIRDGYPNIKQEIESNTARAVYWLPTTCDSLAERGYTCLSCGESLHCMGGNFALKAICGGRRPFCYNGVCSDIRGEKCRRDDGDAHTAPSAPQHSADTESVVEHNMDNSTLT